MLRNTHTSKVLVHGYHTVHAECNGTLKVKKLFCFARGDKLKKTFVQVL